jgi:hypothetical protein
MKTAKLSELKFPCIQRIPFVDITTNMQYCQFENIGEVENRCRITESHKYIYYWCQVIYLVKANN